MANVDEDLSYHSDQVRLREFIETVKQDEITDDVKDDFSDYIDSIDCSPVVLGCTELPLLVSEPKTDGLLDPMQVAIDYVVKKAY
mgnify:FL=1